MATDSVAQSGLSQGDAIETAATLPIAAAHAPIPPATVAASTVEPWHVEFDCFVVDEAGVSVAMALDPKLAQAIAQGGGYTLPKPTGPMAETMTAWDGASRRQMAEASEWKPEPPWPDQVDTFTRWIEGVAPHCESDCFDSDAERRDAVITTAVEWELTPQHAHLDAAGDALQGLLVRGSLEHRLLNKVMDAATALYVHALQVGIAATDAMGAEGVPDVAPERLTAMARELQAKL